MNKSKTFCPIPWIFQAVRANGDLRVCCQANISKGRGVLPKENGINFNARGDNLVEARNNQVLKKMRLNMLKGEWSSDCIRCQQEEQNGLRSRRIYEMEQWSFNQESAESVTSDNGAIDTKASPVIYYDLRFGNLCNLACRMCSPADSSAWYSDWVKLYNKTTFNDTHGVVNLELKSNKYITNTYDWHQSDSFWKQISNNLENINHVYMAGGEPLLIKNHYDFLQQCVDRKFASQIVLEYNTNCTKLPQRALDLWTKFKEVRIGASIDGYGKYIEYQRYPVKWDNLYENLVKINNLPNNIYAWFALTITSYNIFHLTDFMKWKLVNKSTSNFNRSKKRPIITHHMAHNPKYLNIRSLPDGLKDQVANKFKEFVYWVEGNGFSIEIQNEAKKITSTIQDYMTSADYNKEYWSEFCDYTAKLDAIRQQNFLVLQPNFEEYFNV